MTFNEELRLLCKAKVNPQALPTKHFPFYLALKYDWCKDTHVIGFECGFAAIFMECEYTAKGVDTGITNSYPFELMNPEIKNERKRDSGNKTPRETVHGKPSGRQEGVPQPVKEVAPGCLQGQTGD